MELRTESPRKYVQTRLVNHCAQCGETIFLPEWSEYMDRATRPAPLGMRGVRLQVRDIGLVPRPIDSHAFRRPKLGKSPAAAGGSLFLNVRPGGPGEPMQFRPRSALRRRCCDRRHRSRFAERIALCAQTISAKAKAPARPVRRPSPAPTPGVFRPAVAARSRVGPRTDA
jgi:hypothetical protein